MKYCSKCGAKNPAEARFCAECGNQFPQETTMTSQNVTPKFGTECSRYIMCNGYKAVDLGLRVLWSTCEVGASSFSDRGLTFSWGDETRKTITSKWSNAWFSPTKSSNICGSSHDMVRYQWGSPWRLPTRDNFAELVQNCQWDFIDYNGSSYVKFTGPNGNFIMMHSDIMLWIGDNARGDYVSAFRLDVDNEICGDISLYYNVDRLCLVRGVVDK